MDKRIIELRHALHACPEISGMEVKTKRMLIEWLSRNTSLEIHEINGGFYAAHKEADPQSTIAFRADYDALARPEGAAHLCGHDGHAAGLCGLALELEGKKLGRNVILLFQSGEENGSGAAKCCEIFQREKIDEIYGLHNLPGFEYGRVYTSKGTFACASRGLTISLEGKPAHAAYPENGISPALSVGKILCDLEQISSPENYSGMVMCTVIGVKMGEKAFGASAENAEIWLTLRGERNTDIQLLQNRILERAGGYAQEKGLVLSSAVQDVFPAVENDCMCAEKVLRACKGELLESPMRWSEDFGHYLLNTKGAFLGIGAGKDYAPLHTEGYEYPDSLLEYSIEAFINILSES